MNMRPLVFVMALGLAASGCATREYVREYVQSQLDPVNSRIDGLEKRTDERQKTADAQLSVLGGRVQYLDNDLQDVKTTLRTHGERLDSLSRTAQEALDRATAAGQLAEGKLLYEVVLTNDTLKFPLEKATLGNDARAVLDEFLVRIKSEGKPVFIEIQGHTDSTGSYALNEALGQQRADAVRRYLHDKGIPLSRMSAISYGETRPMADNMVRAGRQANRRVVLVVLR